MNASIDGSKIASEADFHREIAAALKFPPHYGANLDALWDTLSTDVERPVFLTWVNAKKSTIAMPEKFDVIVRLLRDVEEQDRSFGWTDRFNLLLE
jgi:ribonuclease inhibitor